MSDWAPLRDYLGAWLDEEIAGERDPTLRSMLRMQRDRILDHVELGITRRWLVQEQEAGASEVVPLNGKRVIRVDGRRH
jgi:hypothetical protein